MRQMLLHTEAFEHRRLYTQKHLPRDALTHTRLYTQKLLGTDCFQIITEALTPRSLYTENLLHTESFALARERSTEAPPWVRAAACAGWTARWAAVVAVAVPRALATSLLELPPAGDTLTGTPPDLPDLPQAGLPRQYDAGGRPNRPDAYREKGAKEKQKRKKKVLHTQAFPQNLLHREAFTHRSFYTQTPLHTETCTHGGFYAQKLLHREAFTHRRFPTEKPIPQSSFYTLQ